MDDAPTCLTGTQLLTETAGRWDGEFRLWFRPDELAAHSASRATISSELRGRSALLRYDWSFGDDHHEGLALLGRADDGTVRMAWTETFGYAGDVMDCRSSGDEANVLGHYAAEGERWGWRTTFAKPSSDELVIRAFNITPQGAEQLATEARYRRIARP